MRKPKIIELRRITQLCPDQWEGRLRDGRHIYIRVRHGAGRISFGPTAQDATQASAVFTWQADGVSDIDLLSVLKDAGIKIKRGIIPKTCDLDHDEQGVMGCSRCGAPATEAAINKWREQWKAWTSNE